MEVVPADSFDIAHVKAFFKHGKGLSHSSFVGFLFADEDLDLASHKGTD